MSSLTPDEMKVLVLNNALYGYVDDLVDYYGRCGLTEELFRDLHTYLNHPDTDTYEEVCIRCAIDIVERGVKYAWVNFENSIYVINNSLHGSVRVDAILTSLCDCVLNGLEDDAISIVRQHRGDKTPDEIRHWFRTEVDPSMPISTLYNKCGTMLHPSSANQRLPFPFRR